jgi:L-glutamine-phosphate cytidylyltransferase
MRAVIFAAGKSTRLGELTKDTPKSCLPINASETILERSLKLLNKYGFEEIFIITGFKESVIKKIISKHTNSFKCIETIYNKEFETKNNYYTALLSADLLGRDTLILNSDIVYSEKILKYVKKEMQKSSESFMVIDNSKPSIDEDMKVYIDAKTHKITRINKKLENNIAFGEYIGIMRINDSDLKYFKNQLNYMFKNNDIDKYYEDALDQILEKIDIYPLSTKGEEWTEIDFPEDYIKAKNLSCIKQVSLQN